MKLHINYYVHRRYASGDINCKSVQASVDVDSIDDAFVIARSVALSERIDDGELVTDIGHVDGFVYSTDGEHVASLPSMWGSEFSRTHGNAALWPIL